MRPIKLLLLTLSLAALAGCPPSVEPKPAPIPKDTALCGDAEANLERLQCKDLRGDPMWVNRNGERFKDTCEEAQEEGRVALNPGCVSDAKTCEEAKRCPVI